jgi:hypothetical protein
MRRYEPRHCGTCGKKVDLTFFGMYRRHFASDASGRRHLCPASGRSGLTETEAAQRRRPG